MSFSKIESKDKSEETTCKFKVDSFHEKGSNTAANCSVEVNKRQQSTELNSFYYTKDPPSPTTEIDCTAVFRKPKKIVYGITLLRLRHQNRGTYVNTIKPYFWESATLGESREYLFRIFHHEGRYVRIEISEPRYPGCMCAYPTVCGGIYFDKRDAKDDRQLWEMSIRNPVDGDVVTFRNKKWPNSGLKYHKGADTNVYCMKNHDLEKWILEVAE